MHKRHAPAFKSAPMNSHWNDQTKKNNYNVVLTANKLKYNPAYQTRAYGRKQTALYGFVLFLLFYSSSPSCKTGRGVSIGVQTPRCHINYYTREWLEPSLSLEYHERKRGLQNAKWTLQMHWQSMVDMFQRVPAGVNRTHASFLNALAALKKEKGGKERGRKGKLEGAGCLNAGLILKCLSQLREITQFIAPLPLHSTCIVRTHKTGAGKVIQQSWLKAMCHYRALWKRRN